MFFIAYYIDLTVLGVYTLVQSFAQLFLIVASTAKVVLPEISNLNSSNNNLEMFNFLNKVYSLTLFLGFVFLYFSSLIYYPLVNYLFIEQSITETIGLFFLLTSTFIIKGSMNSIDISLTAIGKPEKLLSIVTLPVVMRLILYPILLNISSDILVLASIRLSSVVLVQYLTVNLLPQVPRF